MYKIRKGWSAYNIGFKFHVIINELKVFLGSKNWKYFVLSAGGHTLRHFGSLIICLLCSLLALWYMVLGK